MIHILIVHAILFCVRTVLEMLVEVGVLFSPLSLSYRDFDYTIYMEYSAVGFLTVLFFTVLVYSLF